MSTDGAPPPFPFVVGVNRSGTTLLRMMLDAHPDLAIPPETHFVPELIDAFRAGSTEPLDAALIIAGQREWGDFGIGEEALAGALRSVPEQSPGAYVRAFFRLYADGQSKPRYGDKTPAYGKSMTAIAEALPEARFIHLIRDGRDVLLSVRDRSPRPRPAERVAARWRDRVTAAREQALKLPHYDEFHYEDLVALPEVTLRRICERLELPWDTAMLTYHERSGERLEEMSRALPPRGDLRQLSVERRLATHRRTTESPDRSRVSRWRTELTEEDRERFESVAGALLQELGYDVGNETR